LAAGILAGLALAGPAAGRLWALPWLAGGALTAAASAPWRAWRLACLPLGILLVLLHEANPTDTLSRRLPRPACRIALRAVVCDAQCHGDGLELLPPAPAATMSVEGVRLPGEAGWTKASAQVLVLLPEGVRVAYGERLLVQGVVLPSDPAPFAGAFDYRKYLRQNGIPYLIEAASVTRDGVAGGITGAIRRLLIFRDSSASRLVAHVSSEDHAGILLAMTFGFRQTLRPETRAAFLRSGTIHVFSVSGLHVGMVGIVLGTLLQLLGLPYRGRYAAVPVLLGIYVVMTGAAPSAVRAWLMVCAVCWGRVRFLAVSPLNGVALAALAILLWEPLTLLQAGFLYSFTTVATLVLGWPLLATLVRDLRERDAWLPRPLRPHLQTGAVRTAVQTIGASAVAWFGGAGLMLYLSAMVVPAALPVNIVLIPLAYALLVLAIPKMVLACLPLALPDAIAGKIMSGLVEAIQALAITGSAPGGSWAVPTPPMALVAVYYVALFVALASRLPRPGRLAAAAGAGVLLAAASWIPWQSPRLALVWGGDCDVPVVALERDDGLPPLVLHTGTMDAQRALLNWLQRRGHRRVDAVVFGWDFRRTAERAAAAVRLLQADTLILPAAPRPGSPLQQAVVEQQSRGGRVRFLTGAPAADGTVAAGWPGGEVIVQDEGDRRRIRIVTRGVGIPQTVEISRDPSGRHRLTLCRGSGSPAVTEVVPTFQRSVIEIVPK
jgi:ComEC/Rec2-related protein